MGHRRATIRKDSIASLIIAHMATFFAGQGRLRPGEKALCQLLAVNREQSEIVLELVRPFFRNIAPLRQMVVNETETGLLLSNNVEITIETNNFRALRGKTVLLSIFDECSFWMDDKCARPDEETYRAVRPSMMTLPDSMLVAISSPWRESGLLWKKFDKHFGRDDDRVLVVRAASTILNPLLDVAEVQEALQEDPSGGAAEWLGQFRCDLESFLSREVIAAVVNADRPLELPPRSECAYCGFLDAGEGGPNGDSFTAGVAHLERREDNDFLVLDACRETRSPFKPTEVIEQMVLPLFKTYGVRRVKADRHAEGFIKDLCRNGGLTVEADALPKSDIYREMLPWLNSRRCELPSWDRFLNQIQGLERGPSRSGRESIDHQRGGHDDIVNSAFGAMLEAAMHGAGINWKLHGPRVVAQSYAERFGRVTSFAGVPAHDPFALGERAQAIARRNRGY